LIFKSRCTPVEWLREMLKVKRMTSQKTRLMAAILVVVTSTAAARAQGTGRIGTGAGGTATTGTGVPTGSGALSQPIPPAASTLNPPPNRQRPQNYRGPALTSPPQNPFGTR
jgi:hypothetical protein